MSRCKNIKFLVFTSNIKYQIQVLQQISNIKFKYQVLNFLIFTFIHFRVYEIWDHIIQFASYIYAIFAILLTSYSINFIVIFIQHAWLNFQWFKRTKCSFFLYVSINIQGTIRQIMDKSKNHVWNGGLKKGSIDTCALSLIHRGWFAKYDARGARQIDRNRLYSWNEFFVSIQIGIRPKKRFRSPRIFLVYLTRVTSAIKVNMVALQIDRILDDDISYWICNTFLIRHIRLRHSMNTNRVYSFL